MPFDFLTFEHVNLTNRRVLVRFDLNCPVNPATGDIMSDERINDAIPTLQALEHAAVVVVAHQSRPGESDFLTLERHAQLIQQKLFRPVKYISDDIGPTALSEIKKLKPGEILVLENIRFLAEENLQGPPDQMARTYLVQRLAPLFDYFVLDAFPVMHRSQPSVVGLAYCLPTIVGLSAERELTTLGRVLHNPIRPAIFVMGGSKLADKVKLVKAILKNNKADQVLITGLMANAFLKVKGYPIDIKEPEPRTPLEYDIQQVLETYKDSIALPIDLACDEQGKRVEYMIDDIPQSKRPLRALDIGTKTLKLFTELIKDAGTITANGPAGLFEKPPFDQGTVGILNAIADSSGLTVIGGGHLASEATRLNLQNKIKLISSGGGATIDLLSGKNLPAIDVLHRSATSYLESKAVFGKTRKQVQVKPIQNRDRGE